MNICLQYELNGSYYCNFMSGWIVADKDADLYYINARSLHLEFSQSYVQGVFGTYKDEFVMFTMPSIDSLHGNKSITTMGSVLLL